MSPKTSRHVAREPEVVVVTGAAGCLGFHTIKLLISRDPQVSEVRCLDLREPEELMLSELQTELAQHPNKIINWIRGDIRDLALVESTFEGASCVINCAAKIDIWTHKRDQHAKELQSVNVDALESMMKACKRLNVPKFVHVSSFEIYANFDTIYYATENTLPEVNRANLLFGHSATSKMDAELVVKKVALHDHEDIRDPEAKPNFRAVIIRLPQMYGEFDRHYVSKILEATKIGLGGKLIRLTHVWIRQQPIYATNAAWSLVVAKNRLDFDESISGEEFHITDDTPIVDPFDFVQDFVEARGMEVTKHTYPFVIVFALVWLFFALRSLMGLKTHSKTGNRWYDYVMPQTLAFMCNSSFLNRTKASLRLDYEPIVDADQAKQRSLYWYEKHLAL